jgi:uncharacterized protein (DUF4415 family)
MKNLTNKFPPLTPAQQAEISALQAMPDESIDYSDIPPLTEEFWQNATRNRFAKKAKKTANVRFDADFLQWLKKSKITLTLFCVQKCKKNLNYNIKR